MKNKSIIFLALLLAAITFWSCNNNRAGNATGEENLDRDASYALGMSFGMEMKEDMAAGNVFPFVNDFIQGFTDSMSGGRTRFSVQEAGDILEAAFNAFAAERNAEAAHYENTFLAENSRKPGVIITSSGLQYEIIYETDGRKPLASDVVRVHYEGRLIDGTLFDSTLERGEPVEFNVDRVIPGWTEGLQLMGIGSTFILYIPSALGYGPNGVPPIIPPFSPLIFIVELLDII
jgi:FKBP-type peptidyl-prolyl cis-trans isomerase